MQTSDGRTIDQTCIVDSVTGGGGPLPYKRISTADTNSALVKTGATRAYSLHVINLNAAVRYLKLYNKATAPTVGTDVPVMTIRIPATGSERMDISLGILFPLGLGVGLTTGIADNDTGAVAAGEQVINIAYA